MHLSHRTRLGLGALTLASVIGGYIFFPTPDHSVQDDGSKPIGASPALKSAKTDAPALATQDIQEKQTSKPQDLAERSADSSPSILMLEIAKESNPYAHAITLRNSKQSGAFAVAYIISIGCRNISRMLPDSYIPDARAANNNVAARQAVAEQDIRVRCQGFVDDRSIAEPLPGDKYGEAFQSAMRNIEKSAVNGSGFPRKDLEELASQGVLFVGLQVSRGGASVVPYFNGEIRGGLSDNESFGRAMAYALATLGDTDSAEAKNLNASRACMMWAACEGTPDDIAFGDLPASSPMRAAAKKLAPAIRSALLANNVDAFAPPSPK